VFGRRTGATPLLGEERGDAGCGLNVEGTRLEMFPTSEGLLGGLEAPREEAIFPPVGLVIAEELINDCTVCHQVYIKH